MAIDDIQVMVRHFARVSSSVVGQQFGGQEAIAINSALREYSARNPRELVVAVTPAGKTYALGALVPGWGGSHRVRTVRSGSAIFDPELWSVYPTASGYVLRLEIQPASDFLVEYICPHTLDDDTDTISTERPEDVEAFCHLAASKVLEQAANYYAPQNSSSIQADSIDQNNLRQAYALQSREEYQHYQRLMAQRPTPTSIRVDIDMPNHGGRGRFFESFDYR